LSHAEVYLLNDVFLIINEGMQAEIETFAKRFFLPNFCVSSNFNPQNTKCIPVVKIFTFLEREQK